MRVTIVIAVLISFAVLSFHCGDAALAAEATPSPSKVPGAVDIGESIIGPTSPLYFLKTAKEYFETRFFTPVNDLSKVVREMEFAQRRLREVKYLIKHKRQDLVVPIMEQYRNYNHRADKVAPSRENIQVELAQIKARHLDVLMRLYDETGEPDAKRAIRAAIVEVEEFGRGVLEKIEDPVIKNNLSEKISLWQAAACNFIVREASSSALNDTERFYFSQKAKECMI